MNILLVGNGFDLHHMYPTGYINFLHTFQFLTGSYDDSFDSIGKIFGNEHLQANDEFIKDCYTQHSRIYDSTPLAVSEAKQIIGKAKNNLWYNYLCTCVTKDIRWIDFEKEISRVIEAFSDFLECDDGLYLMNNHVVFDSSEFPSNVENRHILSHFNFFFEDFNDSILLEPGTVEIKKQYIYEKVVGSKSYYTRDDDIISELYNSLRELADILQWYLQHFIDAPSREYAALGYKPRFPSYPHPYRVYSFNYTNTIELLYDTNMVDHIHGNTQDHIVLGVNPDANDNLSSINTSFLQFKKYFQRTYFRTDYSYIQSIKTRNSTPHIHDTHLFVMGHSLDITDKDIIMQIFDVANKITILYHKESSIKNLIRNLVEMYGKDGFDELRTTRDLQFMPQAKIEWIQDKTSD